MSESSDYSAGPWEGHDFASARRSYDEHVGRSYEEAVDKGKATKDLIAENVSTKSTSPLIFVIDQTGSMGEWPGVIYSKLPYLENEGKEYLGEDFEACFMAIGDAHHSEKYPLQVRPFAKGLELKKRLDEIVQERGGGPGLHETYELAALYIVEKLTMPNAINPITIFIGDEMPYDTISKEHAKDLVGVNTNKVLLTKDVFEKLKAKSAVYFIHKTYSTSGENGMSSSDKEVLEAWTALVGRDHICDLPAAERVVDVTFGILAKESGRISYFEHELEDRQLKDAGGEKKVDIVYKSLMTIHTGIGTTAGGGHTGKSVIKRKSGEKTVAAKSLI